MPQVIAGGKTFTYQNGDKGDKWFYHADGRCKLAYSCRSDELYAEGFVDSPDDATTDISSIPGTVEAVPDKRHDISTWDKDKLIDYAHSVFGVKLKKNFSQANLVKQIEELEANGDIQGTD